MKPWSNDDISKVLDGFIRKATTDKKFRELALKSPEEAIKQLVGKDLPADYKVRAVARDGADIVFVVPDLVKAGGELSDSELEQVAGGRCPASCAGSYVCGISSTVGPCIPGVGGACA
jgi:hypothetical protein